MQKYLGLRPSRLVQETGPRLRGVPPPRASQEAGADNDLGDSVGVAVGRGPPVLEVPPPLQAHLARDADAGAAVGHAGGESVDAGRLLESRETPQVVLTPAGVVHTDVLGVSLPQLLDGLLDVPYLLGASRFYL